MDRGHRPSIQLRGGLAPVWGESERGGRCELRAWCIVSVGAVSCGRALPSFYTEIAGAFCASRRPRGTGHVRASEVPRGIAASQNFVSSIKADLKSKLCVKSYPALCHTYVGLSQCCDSSQGV
jgi:hypothetical protein